MDSTSIQTAVYRLSARLHENLSETARDLGLQGLDAANLASSASSAAGGAAGAGAAGKYLEDGAVITDEGVRETKKLLETRRDASMTEGLRRVLAVRPTDSRQPAVPWGRQGRPWLCRRPNG